MARPFAHFFSFIGHPLFVLTYLFLILFATNPYSFGFRDLTEPRAVVLLLSVFGTTVLLPAVGIGLMKPLGMVRSLELPDKQERIGPYIIVGTLYLWLYQNVASTSQTPELFKIMVLGGAIGLFLNFFLNIFFKISAHAAGMGGFLSSVLLIASEWQGYTLGIPAFGGSLQIAYPLVIALVILLAGCVGTARLALGAHTPYELWRGYLSGGGGVLIAALIL